MPTLSESEQLFPEPSISNKPVTSSDMILRGMLGGQSSEQWIAKYERSHQHPVNRLCHTYEIYPHHPDLGCRFRRSILPPSPVVAGVRTSLRSDGCFSSSATRLKASRRNSFTTGVFCLLACDGGGPRSTAEHEPPSVDLVLSNTFPLPRWRHPERSRLSGGAKETHPVDPFRADPSPRWKKHRASG